MCRAERDAAGTLARGDNPDGQDREFCGRQSNLASAETNQAIMTDKREVVITGTGVVSPVGIGKQSFWQALLAGQSGVERLRMCDPSELPVPFGAELKSFQPKEFVTPRKSLKVMCREIQTGFAAARLAMDDARLTAGAVDSERLGVLFGSDMLYCDLPDMADAFRAAQVDRHVELAAWGEIGLPRLYPLWLLMYLPNMTACHLAIAHDARGPNNSITAGDTSSLLALFEATRYIERGLADVMLTGGSGTRLNPTQLVYRSDSVLSHRSSNPAAASRPFEAGRDGMVNGEGAAAFVLESRTHAEARGAKIQARVLGCGQAFDGVFRGGDQYPEVSPEGFGIQHAMHQALREAQLEPADIGHVNAHGDSTRAGDRREAAAIRAVLGPEVPVTAPKSFFGNLGAGSGAVELAASVLALQEGQVPFTLNYEMPDPECDIRVVRDAPLPAPRGTALVLNQSSLGQAVAVVLAQA